MALYYWEVTHNKWCCVSAAVWRQTVPDLSTTVLVCLLSPRTHVFITEWWVVLFLWHHNSCACVFLCVSIVDWFKYVNKSSASPQNAFSRRSCCCWIFCSSGDPGGQRSASTWDTAPPGHVVLPNNTHHTYMSVLSFHLSELRMDRMRQTYADLSMSIHSHTGNRQRDSGVHEV